VIVAAIFAGQVMAASRIWGENSTGMAVLKILGLSVITYVIWYIAAVLMAFLLGLYSPAASRGVEVDIYYSTLGMPLYPCDAAPLLDDLTGGAVCDLPGFVIGVPLLFIVGLAGAVLLDRVRKSESVS